jgi:hypothetical protein
MSSRLPSRAEENAAIQRFVFTCEADNDGTAVSTFRAVLRDARTLSRRTEDLGEPLTSRSDAPTSEWAACLMYLIALELIGKVLRPNGGRILFTKKRKRADEPEISRAMRYFGQWITPLQREAIVALRNSFAHDFGLSHRRGPRTRWHKFRLTSGESWVFPVYLPRRRWNGEYGAKSRGGPTIVNLPGLAEWVEEIVQRVEFAAQYGGLRLTAGMSIAELDSRFGFRVDA